jgi:hypothetical protein
VSLTANSAEVLLSEDENMGEKGRLDLGFGGGWTQEEDGEN